MENSIKLPEEYSNSGEIDISNYDLEGNDLNLQTIDSVLNLDDSDVYKMVGEENAKNNAASADVSNYQVKQSEPVQLNVKEEEEQVQSPKASELIDRGNIVNVSNNEEQKLDNDNNLLEIDKKISNLQQILDNIVKENNIENVNSFISETPTNIISNEYKNDNVVNDIKNIINEINNLENKKNNYSDPKINNSSISTNNVNNLLKESNLFKDSGNVLFDNFTPNLRIDPSDPNYDPENPKPWKKQQATEKAINTEKAMGGDPIVEVVPGVGDVVIDNSTQGNVREAVEQHGGWDKAISDSTSNQNNYYENLESTESSPNYNTESNSTIQNESFANTKTENITENFPEPNKDLVKNSSESIVVLNKISQQLDVINKSLSKSFGTLGKSIKDIKSEQKNYFYNSTNNNTSSNNTPVNNNGQGGQANNIPEIRGDTPLKDDFPSNFKLDSLFSNLRS